MQLGEPLHHLQRRATRERQHQNARGIDTVNREMRHPMGERARLAGAGACDDQQRAGLDALRKSFAVARRLPLGRVQFLEM